MKTAKPPLPIVNNLDESHLAITQANRIAWNVVTERHRQTEFNRLVKILKDPDPSRTCLSKNEIHYLHGGVANINGKSIVQLACNNGSELMSLKKLGAARCLGIDISDEVIKYASDLAKATNIDCQFLRSDIYAIDNEYHAQFDIVYITVGALGWLPDINLAFKSMQNLLKSGGHVLIHEMHPILDMFKPDIELTQEEKTKPAQFADSYFRTEAFISTGGIDYINHTNYISTAKEYWHHHKLSDIIQAGIDAGLNLQFIKECAEHVSMSYERLSKDPCTIPMSYMLRFQKL